MKTHHVIPLSLLLATVPFSLSSVYAEEVRQEQRAEVVQANWHEAYDLMGYSRGQQFIIRAIGELTTEEALRARLTDWYNYLNANATKIIEQGFFPDDPDYREAFVAKQVVFFTLFLKGELTVELLKQFEDRHDGNPINTITNELFDEFLNLSKSYFATHYPDLSKVLDIQTLVEPFRPYVVTNVGTP
ncbi:hypothetical protein [Vibrio ouci]|uniref:DUF2059 domain-containing protein n=1 Tax=Vibrio ouci TaxID=2499078 RepID=A0A4Y8WCG0_9VIBR|nr:hypothetical protein [Vibrio ouci]TFH90255.1 hypothetical protein ELS82_17590 [Vibrio ouci]